MKNLGPTKTFPQGKLNRDDEGGLAIAIASDPRNQVVVIDFGSKVAWVAMPKSQALELSDLIRKRAEELPDPS